MTKLDYSGDRFPPEIIQLAIWLDLRFSSSFREVEPIQTRVTWRVSTGNSEVRFGWRNSHSPSTRR